jgi:hypothetical protein
MQCIYFIHNECRADPRSRKINVEGIAYEEEEVDYYKPTEEDQKFCRNLGPEDFTFCPRYRAYLEYLKTPRLEK